MTLTTTCLFVFLTLMWLYPAVTGGETHSLTYIYTALSKPVNLPGIHEFTAMGLLDGRMIDYYDSTSKKKVPKQPWMEENLDKDYWDKGTLSRQSKEQWFKVNLGVLKDRSGHNDTGLHVFQWRVGCEAERQGDNSLKFIHGIHEYGYDGENLAFDVANKRWITSVDLASAEMLNDNIQGYLEKEKECVYWLSRFVDYRQAELIKSDHPDVFVFTTKGNRVCLATGFHPQKVGVVNIRRKGIVLDEGMWTSGVRPNEDGTFQVRVSMEILESDRSEDYDCIVTHSLWNNGTTVKKWDESVPVVMPCLVVIMEIMKIMTIIAIIIIIAVSLLIIHFGLFRRKKARPNSSPSEVMRLNPIETFDGTQNDNDLDRANRWMNLRGGQSTRPKYLTTNPDEDAQHAIGKGDNESPTDSDESTSSDSGKGDSDESCASRDSNRSKGSWPDF